MQQALEEIAQKLDAADRTLAHVVARVHENPLRADQEEIDIAWEAMRQRVQTDASGAATVVDVLEHRANTLLDRASALEEALRLLDQASSWCSEAAERAAGLQRSRGQTSATATASGARETWCREYIDRSIAAARRGDARPALEFARSATRVAAELLARLEIVEEEPATAEELREDDGQWESVLAELAAARERPVDRRRLERARATDAAGDVAADAVFAADARAAYARAFDAIEGRAIRKPDQWQVEIALARAALDDVRFRLAVKDFESAMYIAGAATKTIDVLAARAAAKGAAEDRVRDRVRAAADRLTAAVERRLATIRR